MDQKNKRKVYLSRPKKRTLKAVSKKHFHHNKRLQLPDLDVPNENEIQNRMEICDSNNSTITTEMENTRKDSFTNIELSDSNDNLGIARDFGNTEETILNEFSFIDKEEYDNITEHELYYENVSKPQNNVLSGNRIVNLQYVLNWAMDLQLEHSKLCSVGKMQVVEENCYGLGLVSCLTFQCNFCSFTIKKFTEDPQLEKSKINYGAVFGTLSSGSTYSNLSELLGIMDIPKMPYNHFKNIELELGDSWKNSLWTSMEAAGKEELAYAISKNQIDADGVPWITVFLDGGWSHRSYGHNYNASSGVAVIIGRETGKLLFLGVRNKYCSVCARATNLQTLPKDHNCYKNWTGSSGAMEADIIVDGFKHSEESHGLRYLQFVADGDSSVYAKIRKDVPYGFAVTKIECKNHAIKNYGSALYKIKDDSKINLEGRKLLTAKKIKELEDVAMKAIYINANGDVEKLKKDLANGPDHVFGNHDNCIEDYCSYVGVTRSNIFEIFKASGIYDHIQGVLDRVINKGHRLIDNETNNRAELFMSILCKFNVGKRLNLTQRGSFQTRTYLTGLRYNEGAAWQKDAWKINIGSSPGKNFKKFLATKQMTQDSRVKKRLEFRSSKNTIQSVQNDQETTLKPVNCKGYGPNCQQAQMTQTEYESERTRLMNKLRVTQEDISRIERETVGQWGNQNFEIARHNRLTASMFGNVIKRRPKTFCEKLVKRIINKSNFTNAAIEYGKSMEAVARQKFAIDRPKAKVQECGIFIDEQYNFLAASPDGLVGSNAIIEIKCLHKVHKSGKTLAAAAASDKTLCVELENGKIKLKRNHNYYYQIQGQLNIAKKDLCFFVVYVNDQQNYNVEVISRDQTFWEEVMIPKLTSFYYNCLLPRIIDPNKSCLDSDHSRS